MLQSVVCLTEVRLYSRCSRLFYFFHFWKCSIYIKTTEAVGTYQLQESERGTFEQRRKYSFHRKRWTKWAESHQSALCPATAPLSGYCCYWETVHFHIIKSQHSRSFPALLWLQCSFPLSFSSLTAIFCICNQGYTTMPSPMQPSSGNSQQA